MRDWVGTIDELEAIRDRVNERIARDWEESGFKSPRPHVSSAVVRYVLEEAGVKQSQGDDW